MELFNSKYGTSLPSTPSEHTPSHDFTYPISEEAAAVGFSEEHRELQKAAQLENIGLFGQQDVLKEGISAATMKNEEGSVDIAASPLEMRQRDTKKRTAHSMLEGEDEGTPSLPSSGTVKRKKRPPINGFRAPNDGLRYPHLLPDESDCDESLYSTNTTPNAHSIGDTITKIKPPKNTSKTPGAQIPHAGSVYPTRYSILRREDAPYLCHLCGEAFKHPQNVAEHFHGPEARAKKTGHGGCWAEHGKPKNGKSEWNFHGSCKVGLAQVSYVKCKDGYVVLDQESLDRIEEACEVGRRAKKQMKRR